LESASSADEHCSLGENDETNDAAAIWLLLLLL
jgi:hypothetical protein